MALNTLQGTGRPLPQGIKLPQMPAVLRQKPGYQMPFMQGPRGGGGSQEQTLCQVAGASKAQMGSENAGWLGVGSGGGQLVQAHFPRLGRAGLHRFKRHSKVLCMCSKDNFKCFVFFK